MRKSSWATKRRLTNSQHIQPLYYENETFTLEMIMFTSITNTMCLFIKLLDSMRTYTCYVYNLYQLTTINNKLSLSYRPRWSADSYTTTTLCFHRSCHVHVTGMCIATRIEVTSSRVWVRGDLSCDIPANGSHGSRQTIPDPQQVLHPLATPWKEKEIVQPQTLTNLRLNMHVRAHT